MVCWWAYRFPFLSDLHQPGDLLALHFSYLNFFYSTIRRIIVSYWNWSYFLSDEDRSYRLILFVCMVCILVHGIMSI
jgi:hypothetical protein